MPMTQNGQKLFVKLSLQMSLWWQNGCGLHSRIPGPLNERMSVLKIASQGDMPLTSNRMGISQMVSVSQRGLITQRFCGMEFVRGRASLSFPVIVSLAYQPGNAWDCQGSAQEGHGVQEWNLRARHRSNPTSPALMGC